jgi:hypothetical protein
MFFDAAMNRENQLEIFADVEDSKLEDAETPEARTRVLMSRMDSLFFVFRRELTVQEKVNPQIPKEEQMIRAFRFAKEEYNKKRSSKKADNLRKAKGRAARANRKAGPRASSGATTACTIFVRRSATETSASRSRSPPNDAAA